MCKPTLYDDGYEMVSKTETARVVSVSDRNSRGKVTVIVEIADSSGNVVATGKATHHCKPSAYDHALEDAIGELEGWECISDYDYFHQVAQHRYCDF